MEDIEPIVDSVRNLDAHELGVLKSILIRCCGCGKTIVRNSSNRKLCRACAEKNQRRLSAEWCKRTYKSIHYEHDPYVSGGCMTKARKGKCK